MLAWVARPLGSPKTPNRHLLPYMLAAVAVTALAAAAALGGGWPGVDAHAQSAPPMSCPSAGLGEDCAYHVTRALDTGDTAPSVIKIDNDTGRVYVSNQPTVGSRDINYSYLRIYDSAERGYALIKEIRFNGTNSRIPDFEINTRTNELHVVHLAGVGDVSQGWGGIATYQDGTETNWDGTYRGISEICRDSNHPPACWDRRGNASLTTISLDTHNVVATVEINHTEANGGDTRTVERYEVIDLALDRLRDRAYVSMRDGPILAVDTADTALLPVLANYTPSGDEWNPFDAGADATALAVDEATGTVYAAVRIGSGPDASLHSWGIASLSFEDENGPMPQYRQLHFLNLASNPAPSSAPGCGGDDDDYNNDPCNNNVWVVSMQPDAALGKMFALYRNHTVVAFGLDGSGHPASATAVPVRTPEEHSRVGHRPIHDMLLDADRGLLYASLYDWTDPRVIVLDAGTHSRVGVASGTSQMRGLGLDESDGDVYVLPQWAPSAYVIEGEAKHPLQRRIDAASAGDTITIEPGTYGNAVLDVNKSLTLTSGTGQPGAAVFTGYSRIEVEADDVTVRGLLFRDTDCMPGYGASLVEIRTHNAPRDNVTIENNAFRDTCHAAIQKEGRGAITDIAITGNVFENIGLKIPPGHTEPIDTGGENEFQIMHGAIGLAHHPGQNTVSGNISGNHINGTSAAGIRVFNADDMDISNNYIEGTPASAIGLAHGPSNVRVTGNTIVDANNEPDLDYLAGRDGTGAPDYYKTFYPLNLFLGMHLLDAPYWRPTPDAAINVWSNGLDIDVTGNTIRASDGAFVVCTGVCAFESDGLVRNAGRNMAPSNVDIGGQIRFRDNVVHAHTGTDNNGVLVRSGTTGGELDATSNYFIGIDRSDPDAIKAGRVNPGMPILVPYGVEAVSPNTIRVEFHESVSRAAGGTSAAGWRVEGGDSDGLTVAASTDITAGSRTLNLTLSGSLPDTAPDGITLRYDPVAAGASDAGHIADGAGGNLALFSLPVGDGIAPSIAWGELTGPNAVTIRYSEPVAAAWPQAYGPVTLEPGGSRAVTALSGNATDTHVVTFDGAAADMDAAATSIGIRPAALLDLASPPNRYGPSPELENVAIRPPILVAAVYSPNATGTAYAVGDALIVNVNFTAPVSVTGTPTLAMNASAGPAKHAYYLAGSGTGTLTFRYAVSQGDIADDLDYDGADALGGGRIAGSGGRTIDFSLPVPGEPGSLSSSADLLIDTAAPMLTAADSAADGITSLLRGAYDTAAFAMNGTAHAVVTSSRDNAVQLIRINDDGSLDIRGLVQDNRNLELGFPRGVDTFEMDGDTFALAASASEGVQLIRVHEDGTLAANGTLSYGPRPGDNELYGVDAFEMDGDTFALVTSDANDAVHLIRVHENGTLGANSTLRHGPGLALDGPRGVAAFEMDGDTFALVASLWNKGVQLIRVHADGTLAANSTLLDGPGLALDGSYGVDAFEMDGDTFAIVASRSGGVQLIRVHGNGTLEAGGSLSAASGQVINDLIAIAAFESGGRTYAIATSYHNDTTQLIRVRAGDGALFGAGSASDGEDGFDALRRSLGVDTIDVGGRTFALVVSNGYHAVQLVEMSPVVVTRVAADPGALARYSQGDTIHIDVQFSSPVTAEGPLLLALNSGGTAEYESGSGTDTLRFLYTVAGGEYAADLDYDGQHALSGSGTITGNGSGAAAGRILPPPGSGMSLGDAGDIEIDAVGAPSAREVFSVSGDGAYGKGSRIEVAVAFDKTVLLADGRPPPTLDLNMSGTVRTAEYERGSNTQTLVFAYTVQPGDRADDLDYNGTGALDGDITDRISGAANLTLPVPGKQGSLGDAHDILVDSNIPLLIGAGLYANGTGGFDGLAVPYDMATFRMGGGSYIIATSNTGDAVQLIQIRDDGVLEARDSLADDAALALNGSLGVDAFELDGDTFALVAALHDNGVQLIRIHENGTLRANSTLWHGPALALNGSLSVDAFELDGDTFALVTSTHSYSPVQLIHIGNDGTLEPRGTLADSELELGRYGKYDVAALEIGGKTYALVTSRFDDAVQAIRVDSSGGGTLVPVDSLLDGPALALDGARSVTVFEMDGGTYAAVAAQNENAVQLIRILDGGLLSPAGSVHGGTSVTIFATEWPINLAPSVGSARDGGTGIIGAFQYPVGIDAFSMNGSTYVAVSTPVDQTAHLFRVRGADGALLPTGSNRTYAGPPPPPPSPDTTYLEPPLPPDSMPLAVFDVDNRTYVAAGLDSADGDMGVIELSPVAVANVTSGTDSGTYGKDREIGIDVAFTGPVVAEGRLLLRLNSGGTAEYESGSGTDTLAFLYTVRPGEYADDLDYDGLHALSGSGTIRDANSPVPAGRALPPPGSEASLAGSSDIRIDAVRPVVESVYSPNMTGPHGAGRSVHVNVTFSKAVHVTGGPGLSLDTGAGRDGTAAYLSGSGTDTLAFSYTVRPGDLSDRLAYSGTGALALGGQDGAISDALGNDANLTLPEPRSSGSLHASSEVAIDGVPPSVVSVAVWTPSMDGIYTVGASLRIGVNFSEPVVVAGTPMLALETGGTDRNAEFTPPTEGGGRVAVFVYGPQPGDRTDDLDYANRSALTVGGPTSAAIRDGAGNGANLTLPATGSAGSLGGSAQVRIDAVPPDFVARLTAPDRIAVNFTERVTGAATDPATTWLLGGADAAGLSVSAYGGVQDADSAVLTLSGALAGSMPDIELTYDMGTGDIEDGAGNELRSATRAVADGLPPKILSANITAGNAVTVVYSEPVAAAAGASAYTGLELTPGGARTVTAPSGSPTNTHVITFDGPEAATNATGTLTVNQTALADASGNALGTDEEFLRSVADGQAPRVLSANITAGNAVTVVYSEPVAAAAGASAYASLTLTPGGARGITAPPGGAADTHVIAFDGAAAATNATGTLTVNQAALADAPGNALGPSTAFEQQVADGQAPRVLSANITAGNAVTVVYSEPVAAAAGASAYASLTLTPGGARGITAPPGGAADTHVIAFDGAAAATNATGTLTVNQAALADAPGNALGPSTAFEQQVADGQAPRVLSANITAGNAVTVVYSEPVAAAAGASAYASLTLTPGGARGITAPPGGAADTHVIAFDGPEAATNATGTLTVNQAALADAPGNALGPSTAFEQQVADGQAPRVLSANITAGNAVTVVYSEPVRLSRGRRGVGVRKPDADAGRRPRHHRPAGRRGGHARNRVRRRRGRDKRHRHADRKPGRAGRRARQRARPVNSVRAAGRRRPGAQDCLRRHNGRQNRHRSVQRAGHGPVPAGIRRHCPVDRRRPPNHHRAVRQHEP